MLEVSVVVISTRVSPGGTSSRWESVEFLGQMARTFPICDCWRFDPVVRATGGDDDVFWLPLKMCGLYSAGINFVIELSTMSINWWIGRVFGSQQNQVNRIKFYKPALVPRSRRHHFWQHFFKTSFVGWQFCEFKSGRSLSLDTRYVRRTRCILLAQPYVLAEMIFTLPLSLSLFLL